MWKIDQVNGDARERAQICKQRTFYAPLSSEQEFKQLQ